MYSDKILLPEIVCILTPGLKRPIREADLSPPSSTEVKIAWSRRVYPKVYGLSSWSENCKWYSSLPLGAVVSLFYEPVW